MFRLPLFLFAESGSDVGGSVLKLSPPYIGRGLCFFVDYILNCKFYSVTQENWAMQSETVKHNKVLDVLKDGVDC